VQESVCLKNDTMCGFGGFVGQVFRPSRGKVFFLEAGSSGFSAEVREKHVFCVIRGFELAVVGYRSCLCMRSCSVISTMCVLQ